MRWAETWIEENIPPGANPDIESHEAKAKRLSEKLLAEATEAGFTRLEAEEERERVFAPGAGRGIRQHRLRHRRLSSQVAACAGERRWRLSPS